MLTVWPVAVKWLELTGTSAPVVYVAFTTPAQISVIERASTATPATILTFIRERKRWANQHGREFSAHKANIRIGVPMAGRCCARRKLVFPNSESTTNFPS